METFHNIVKDHQQATLEKVFFMITYSAFQNKTYK